MPEPLIVREPEGEGPRRVIEAWSSAKLFQTLGWIGLLLAVTALVDFGLAFFPTHFSSAEWEFGTVGQIFAGLPLLSLGIAAIWVSGAASGKRWMLLATGLALSAAALVVLLLLAGFALDIPVALRSTDGPARSGVTKMVVKTVFMGLVFGAAFIVTGVLALKQARGVITKGAGL